MEEVVVRLVPLPLSIEGFTLPDENLDYNVYINERLPEPCRRKALRHELDHIEHGDFWDDTRTVAEIEGRNDGCKQDKIWEVEDPGIPRGT